MAEAIGTLAEWSSANMKPDPGEQADSVWAKKVSDNTGYNYFREAPLSLITGYVVTTNRKAFTFTKRPNHNAIKTLAKGPTGGGGVKTHYVRAYADGVDWFDQPGNAAVATEKTYTVVADTTERIDLDISGLTNGVVYLLEYFHGSDPVPNITAYSVHGSMASY